MKPKDFSHLLRGLFRAAAILILLGAGAAAPAQDGPDLSDETEEEVLQAVNQPSIMLMEIRGGTGDRVSGGIELADLPADLLESNAPGNLSFTVTIPLDDPGNVRVQPAPFLPVATQAAIERLSPEGQDWRVRLRIPVTSTLKAGMDSDGVAEVARLALDAPERIVTRRPLKVADAQYQTEQRIVPLQTAAATIAISLFWDPVILFALLSAVVAGIFWLSQRAFLKKFFEFFPPLIWMYFVPMVLTTFGVTPDKSVLYSPFMSQVMLPAILVLLLIPSDIRAIAQLGAKALGVMAIATLGIAVGAIASFALFNTFFPDAFPEGSWKAVASLSGSWIGGSTNMTAVVESLDTPRSLLGPLIVADTVLAYTWLGILIGLAAYQRQIDKWHKADSHIVDEISARLSAEQEAKQRRPTVAEVAFMIGLSFFVGQVCLALGGPIYSFFTDALNFTFLAGIVNSYGWAILLITAVGLFLSTTKVRELEFAGASSIGYVGLYILLTTYGARANLQAVVEVPIFFALGFVWLLIHIAFLYAGIRLLKAPLFLGATSSMANIGGTASAPVVAAAYNSAMAPVGLLMAIFGGAIGTPVALIIVGGACRAIAGG